MAELSFQTRTVTGAGDERITVAEVGGAIDQTTVRGFDEKLNNLIEKGCRCLILNFKDVKYINSTGMGLMVKVADRFTEAGGHLFLAEVSQKIKDIFDMLGLLALFVIHETTQAALDTVSRNGGVGAQAGPEEAELTDIAAIDFDDVAAIDIAEVVEAQAVEVAPVAVAPVEVAPAPPQEVEFPFDTQCAYCEGLLEVATAGAYKCPRCEAYFKVDANGQTTHFTALHPSVIELKLPATGAFLQQLSGLVQVFANAHKLSQAKSGDLQYVVKVICEIVSQKSSPTDILQMTLAGNNKEVVMGFKTSSTAFRDGGDAGDPRLRNIANKVDRMELFALSSRGELLKLIKNLS